MKLKSLFITACFFCSCLLAFSVEQSAEQKNFVVLSDLKHWDKESPVEKLPAVPKPLLSMQRAGDYYDDLKEMKKLLEEKKFFEFYEKAALSVRKKKSDSAIRKMEGRKDDPVAQTVWYHWWHYYVFAAPMLTGKDMKPELKGKWYRFKGKDGLTYQRTEIDFAMKEWAMWNLDGYYPENPEKEVVPTGFTQRQTMLNDAICFQRLMMQFKAAEKEWKAIATEDEKRKTMALNEPIHQDEEGFLEDSYDRRDRILALCDIKAVSDRRYQYAKRLQRDNREKFVKHLLYAYPKNGKLIQQIVMSCGYNTKEEVRDLFIKTVGRDKERDFLYVGLPPLPESSLQQKKKASSTSTQKQKRK